MVERSLTARSALILGCTALGGLVIGVGGIQVGALAPFAGFRIAAGLGGLFGLFASTASVVALYRTRSGSHRTGRENAWAGLVLGASSLAVLIVPALGSGGYPAIHDATTNPDDPPAFSEHVARAPGRLNGVSYPDGGPDVPILQRTAFPDLAPIASALPAAQALERAREVAASLGWEVARSDAAALTLEATHTSRIFRFVDDIAIRVRPDSSGGSILDLRSNSRVGGGDLGANALRIRAFRDAFPP